MDYLLTMLEIILLQVYTSWQNKKPGAKEIYSWTTDTDIWLTKNKYIDSLTS